MRADQLTVVTTIANPVLWESRIKLYNAFEQHMLDSGVRLVTVECTYGDHDPQIGSNPHVKYVRVRATGFHKVWIKENLANLGIAAAPDARYIATIDADVEFRSRTWAARHAARAPALPRHPALVVLLRPRAEGRAPAVAPLLRQPVLLGRGDQAGSERGQRLRVRPSGLRLGLYAAGARMGRRPDRDGGARRGRPSHGPRPGRQGRRHDPRQPD